MFHFILLLWSSGRFFLLYIIFFLKFPFVHLCSFDLSKISLPSIGLHLHIPIQLVIMWSVLHFFPVFCAWTRATPIHAQVTNTFTLGLLVLLLLDVETMNLFTHSNLNNYVKWQHSHTVFSEILLLKLRYSGELVRSPITGVSIDVMQIKTANI